MITIASLYMLAVLVAFLIGAPLALLVPVLLPAIVALPDAEPTSPPVATAQVAEVRGCAAFVAVYAARGRNRPVAVVCSSVATVGAPSPITRAGRALSGAAKAAHEARTKRASAGECRYTGQARSKTGPCRKVSRGTVSS